MSLVLRKLKKLTDGTFWFIFQKKNPSSGYGVRLTEEEFENGNWFKS